MNFFLKPFDWNNAFSSLMFLEQHYITMFPCFNGNIAVYLLINCNAFIALKLVKKRCFYFYFVCVCVCVLLPLKTALDFYLYKTLSNPSLRLNLVEKFLINHSKEILLHLSNIASVFSILKEKVCLLPFLPIYSL